MAKQKARAARHGTATRKKATKRKRVGKTGSNTRQAKTSERAAAGTRQARHAAQTRIFLEVRSLAVAAIEALDAGDLDTVQDNLLTIASRVQK